MILYQIHTGEARCTVDRASYRREWMDNTEEHNAYRCLPLTIANTLGYHIKLREPVTIEWNGGNSNADITVYGDQHVATSLFGHGIITFHVDWLISTDDNTNIFITGPTNHFVRNAQALSGVYESDWAPYSFTMNWKIMEPGIATFMPSDPICHFFVIPREYVESVPVHIKPLHENEQLQKEYNKFDKSRTNFIAAGTSGWQKNYFKGVYVDGRSCPITNHQTKINMKKIDDGTSS